AGVGGEADIPGEDVEICAGAVILRAADAEGAASGFREGRAGGDVQAAGEGQGSALNVGIAVVVGDQGGDGAGASAGGFAKDVGVGEGGRAADGVGNSGIRLDVEGVGVVDDG